MTSENFCYWLQGLLELQPDLTTLTPDQVKMVRDHLGYVFQHVQQPAPATPVAPSPFQYDPLRPWMGTLVGKPSLDSVSIC